MAATLIRLKLQLMANDFTRSVWTILGTLLVLIYGLGMATMLMVVQVQVGRGLEPVQSLLTFSALTGAAAMLLWTLVPLFVSGGDSLMDPRRLITYAVPRRSLIAGLVVAALISVGSVITLMWLVGQVLLWRWNPGALATSLLSLPLLLLTYSMVAQAITTAMSAWFAGRRSRDVLALLSVAVAVGAAPIVMSITSAFESLGEALPRIAEVLSYTPLAAGPALPAAVAEGDLVGTAVRAVVLLATAAAALAVIRAGMVTITERPVSAPRTRTARRGAIGLFAWAPSAPWGAVAARCLTYWFRDPRYGASLIIVPVLAVVGIVMSAQLGDAWMLLGLGPFVAWMLGFGIAADLSYDSTAFAQHVTAGVRGLDDRLGRAAAVLVFALPLTLLAAGIPALLAGGAATVLVCLGLSLGMLLVGVGISSVTSARLLYPVPQPGESPFATPQGSAGRSLIVQFASWLIMVVLMIPELVLWIVWLVTSGTWAAATLLVVALVKGLLVLFWGIRSGARTYDRRFPEIYQQIRTYA
ncbi:transporter [Nesterenkonia lacusekhoensis]|uniref:ABC-2 type transport system permease protein n=1 Tax=Nesterenkonia lacusekhoensis TaxID=150832 RepID=A0ABS4T061_9MICC|nr:transporter [Nesterenkonia lacusekhoensis]MBP2317842.1 ABC-2 type transport system permease protein [Nesterenkonia lacusekhoensis]